MTVLPVVPPIPASIENVGAVGSADIGSASPIELGQHSQWIATYTQDDFVWLKFTAPACEHDFPRVRFWIHGTNQGGYLYTGHPAASTLAELTPLQTLAPGVMVDVVPGQTYYIRIMGPYVSVPPIFVRDPTWSLVQLSLYPQPTGWIEGGTQEIATGGEEGSHRAAHAVERPDWDVHPSGTYPPAWHTDGWQVAAFRQAVQSAPGFIGSHQMYRGLGGPSPWADPSAYECLWRGMWRHYVDGFQWWTDDLGTEHGGGDPICYVITSKQPYNTDHRHAFWWIDCDPGVGFGVSDNVEGRAWAPALRVSLTSMLWGLGPQGGYDLRDAFAFIASQGRTHIEVQQQDPDADMCELHDVWVSFDEATGNTPTNAGTVKWYAAASRNTNDLDSPVDYEEAQNLPLGPLVNRVDYFAPQSSTWVGQGTVGPSTIAANGTHTANYSGGEGPWTKVAASTVGAALELEQRCLALLDAEDMAGYSLQVQKSIREYVTGLTFFGYLDEAFFDNPPPPVGPTTDSSYWESGRQNLKASIKLLVKPKIFRIIMEAEIAPLEVTPPEFDFSGAMRAGRRTFGRPSTTA